MSARTALLPAGLALTACAATAPSSVDPARSTELPTGFDGSEAKVDWRVGDAMLYSLRYEHHGGTDELLVLFEVAALLPEAIACEVRVHDAEGAALSTSRSDVSYDHLVGFHNACELVWRGSGDAHGVLPFREAQQAAASALALFRAVQENEALADEVLWRVIDKPSILGVLRHLGTELELTVGLRADPPRDWARSGYTGSTDAFAIDLDLTLNGEPALDAEALVVEAVPPVHVCAGIVALDMHHAEDPSRRARMELVAARRGPRVGAGAATP